MKTLVPYAVMIAAIVVFSTHFAVVISIDPYYVLERGDGFALFILFSSMLGWGAELAAAAHAFERITGKAR